MNNYEIEGRALAKFVYILHELELAELISTYDLACANRRYHKQILDRAAEEECKRVTYREVTILHFLNTLLTLEMYYPKEL